jgi:hypothetical protein
MAWKVGRGGVYRARVSATSTDGSLTMSAILAVNGSPVGSDMTHLVPDSQTYTFPYSSMGSVSAGDVLALYADAGASWNGTWTVDLMTDNPAFSAAAMFPSYL